MINVLVSCVLSERKKKRVSTIELSHVVLFSFAVVTAHWKASRILPVVFFSFSRLISSFFLSFLYIYIYVSCESHFGEKKKKRRISWHGGLCLYQLSGLVLLQALRGHVLESTQKKKTLTRRATLTLERRRRVSSIPSSTHKRVYLLIYFVFFTFTYSPFCSIHCNRVSTARAFFFFARLAPSLHPSFHSFVCSFFFFKKKKQQKKERSRALFELLQFLFFL